jgi:2-haloacid dehalogenase
MPTVVFDVLGTLFSFDSVIEALASHLPFGSRQEAKRFFQTWMWSSLRDYFATSHSGSYCSLMIILRHSLRRTLMAQEYDFKVNDVCIEKIMIGFKHLTPMPTAVEAINLLQEEKGNWNIWALTNGGKEATRELLKQAGLLNAFGENIKSCDDHNVSKPHRKLYDELRATVQKSGKTEEFYMVATHAWDLAGAKNASFHTVFLTEEEKVYVKETYHGVESDIQDNTMIGCIRKIVIIATLVKWD